tara:strand:- start:271 stop:624 length:354 start_codon:yes stop_codon:yes gene_type:complete
MATEKLQRVTKANVGPRNNVGGTINNVPVAVQDHNKVVDAVNLLFDNQAEGAVIIVETKTCTAASTTTDFANVKVGDTIIVLSDNASEANKFGTAVAAATSPVTPTVDHFIIILRSV